MNIEKWQQTEISAAEKSIRRLSWVIPATVSAATAANVIFFYNVTDCFEEPLLMPEQFPPPEAVPLPVGEVALFSVIWSLAAALVYVVLRVLSKWPEQTFMIVSAAVLLLSCLVPLKAPTPPVSMATKYSLMMMHVIGAIVVVGMLVTLAKKRS